MVAAILTILGYSTNDKVVVYDRVRENLRKYKTMPLRDLIDLSINETLNRTLGTSMTVFLASLPLALFGGESISGFAWVMLFGIVVGIFARSSLQPLSCCSWARIACGEQMRRCARPRTRPRSPARDPSFGNTAQKKRDLSLRMAGSADRARSRSRGFHRLISIIYHFPTRTVIFPYNCMWSEV